VLRALVHVREELIDSTKRAKKKKKKAKLLRASLCHARLLRLRLIPAFVQSIRPMLQELVRLQKLPSSLRELVVISHSNLILL
jgi:hypothetical protein